MRHADVDELVGRLTDLEIELEAAQTRIYELEEDLENERAERHRLEIEAARTGDWR